MFDLPTNRRRLWGPGLYSLGVHAVVGLGLLVSLRARPVHVFTLPGSDLGTRVELAYLPGRAPAAATHPRRVKPHPSAIEEMTPAAAATTAIPAPSALHPPPTPHLTVVEPSPNTAGPASAAPDATTGSDSWGDGSMQIALTTFSPSPRPDPSHSNRW